MYQTVLLASLVYPARRRVLSEVLDEPLKLNPGKYIAEAMTKYSNSRGRLHEMEEMRRLQDWVIFPLNVTFTDCVFEVR